MTRMSKQGERRNQSPKSRRFPSPKTGSLKDKLAKGYKEHANSIETDLSKALFIPKIR